MVSCVIKHLNLVDALQSLINFQYQEEHAEEYDLLCKIMGETFKKLNAMERQLQVSESHTIEIFLVTVGNHFFPRNVKKSKSDRCFTKLLLLKNFRIYRLQVALVFILHLLSPYFIF